MLYSMQRSARASFAFAGAFAIAILPQAAPSAAAAVYYVKPAIDGGNDTNSGLSWQAALATITAAVTKAVAEGNSQVWVARGTYKENVQIPGATRLYGGFVGTETTVSGRIAFPRPPADLNASIIDGNYTSSCLRINPGSASALVVVDGFKLTKGSDAPQGGGIDVVFGTAIIQNCQIDANQANLYGGGIGIRAGASATISNNVITNNLCQEAGGGIYANQSGQITILNNTLSANRANAGGAVYFDQTQATIVGNTMEGNTGNNSGGAVYFTTCPGRTTFSGNTVRSNTSSGDAGGIVDLGSSVYIANSVIQSNSSQDHGGGVEVSSYASLSVVNSRIQSNSARIGGGLDSSYSDVTIERSSISDNAAWDSGGGVYLSKSSSKLMNNVIANNTALQGAAGMFADSAGSGILTNCTITGNSAQHNTLMSQTTPLAITNCIIHDNTAPEGEIQAAGSAPVVTYCDVSGGYAGTGNIDASPRFRGAGAGDYRLLANSPCVDAGSTSAIAGYPYDRAARTRVVGPSVDIGAYEVQDLEAVSIAPASAVLGYQPIRIASRFFHSGGASEIWQCLMLLNTSIRTAGGIYLQYVPGPNTLYLWDEASGRWLGGFRPGSDNVIENAFCRLNCAQTVVQRSDQSMIISWNLEVKGTMSGKRLGGYLYARGNEGTSTGWVQLGSYVVAPPAGNTAPTNLALAPQNAVMGVYEMRNLASVVSDGQSFGNIAAHAVLLNTSLKFDGGVYLLYDANTDKLYLRNDTNTAWLGGFAPGSANVIENSACKLMCAQTFVLMPLTNYMRVNWRIQLKPALGGKHVSGWVYSRDDSGLIDGWDKLADYEVVL